MYFCSQQKKVMWQRHKGGECTDEAAAAMTMCCWLACSMGEETTVARNRRSVRWQVLASKKQNQILHETVTGAASIVQKRPLTAKLFSRLVEKWILNEQLFCFVVKFDGCIVE
jgi:hypothetical protein